MLLALAGCGGVPTPVTDTGAKAAAQEFFEAVVRRDANRAYAVLHPDSQKRWPQARFSSAVETYRRKLRFEPEKVVVRSCEEQGDQAVAHVVITGHGSSRHQRYQDGTVLRKGPDGWRVVLPANFGR